MKARDRGCRASARAVAAIALGPGAGQTGREPHLQQLSASGIPCPDGGVANGVGDGSGVDTEVPPYCRERASLVVEVPGLIEMVEDAVAASWCARSSTARSKCVYHLRCRKSRSLCSEATMRPVVAERRDVAIVVLASLSYRSVRHVVPPVAP